MENCPNCNILRYEWYTILVLCEDCHSPSFIGLAGELPRRPYQCWLCGGTLIDFSFKEFEELQRKGLLKKGFHYDSAMKAIVEEIAKEDAKCQHAASTPEPLHWKGRIYYFQCKFCGRKQFFYKPPQVPRIPKK